MRNPIQIKCALLSAALIIHFSSAGYTQSPDPDKGKTVAQVEKELSNFSREILSNDSTDLKIELNKKFIVRLTNLLKRPESWSHSFDSLKTISILPAQDNSFRIFTWYLVDSPRELNFAYEAHYYFGLIQRRFQTTKGEIQYLVLPLMEMDEIPQGFDNIVTDNYNWFGALYYPLKGTNRIPTYSATTYKLVAVKDPTLRIDSSKRQLVTTYIPGKPRGRKFKEIYAMEYHGHDMKKVKNNYYILTGWNGWDQEGSYKVVEIMSFDPEDSMRVMFGAPVFYFDMIPKSRAFFKYSEFATFTLNTNNVKAGPLNLFNKNVIVFDHLAKTNKAHRSETSWDMGPDGTQDAMEYSDKYDCFIVHKNVTIAEKYNKRQHAKHLKAIHKSQVETAAQDSVMNLKYFPDSKMAKQNKKELRRQKEESDKKIKDSGIQMDKPKKPEIQ